MSATIRRLLPPLLVVAALLVTPAGAASPTQDPLAELSDREVMERTSPPPGASREAFVRRRSEVLRPDGAAGLARPAVEDTATYVCPSTTRSGEEATAAVTVKRTRVKAVEDAFVVYEVVELTRTAEERRRTFYRLETPVWWLGYGLYTARHLYPEEEIQQQEHAPRAELQLTSMPMDRGLPPMGALEAEQTYRGSFRQTVNDPYAGMSLLPEATEVRLRLAERREDVQHELLGAQDTVAVQVAVRNPDRASGYEREANVVYARGAQVILSSSETFRFGQTIVTAECSLYDHNDRRPAYTLAGLLQQQALPSP